MARLTGRALMDDIANTVVEDSEPERQAEEARRKEERRRKRAISKAQKEHAKQKQRILPPVTVTSDSRLNSILPSIQGVIEVNDIGTDLNECIVAQSSPQSARLAAHDYSSHDEEHKDTNPLNVKQSFSSQEVPRNEPNAPINLTTCITTTAYPDSPTPKLDLSRFAFTQRAGPSTKLKSSDIKTAFTSAQEKPRNSKTAPDLSLADIFTTSQLSALSKCVVCELSWTVRKTVPVKILHIKRCASKNAWTEAQVVLAMTEEINNMPAPPEVRNAKGKELAVPEAETHLEHLVNGVAPKKRSKRAQVPHVVTVLHPQEAHAAIIDRKTAIFGGATMPSSSDLLQSDTSAFPSTQPFGRSKLMASGERVGVLGTGMLEDQTSPLPIAEGARSEECRDTDTRTNGVVPPSTQPSHANDLGDMFTTSSIFSHENRIASRTMDDEDRAEMPPPTQVFGNSALAGRFRNPRNPKRSIFDDDHDDCEEENWVVTEPVQLVHNPVCLHNSVTSPPNPQLTPCGQHAPATPSTSFSANAEHLYLPTAAQTKLISLERRLERLHKGFSVYSRQQEVEDQYLSASKMVKARAPVEQDNEDAGGHRPPGSMKKHKAPSSPLSTSKSSSWSRSRSRSRSRKARRRKSRSLFKYDEGMDFTHKHQYDDDTLDQELCRITTEDELLYMRILRYEPINFDIFLKMASQHGMEGRGLRFKLRAFLDRHAINFYGDNASTSNRRRYK